MSEPQRQHSKGREAKNLELSTRLQAGSFITNSVPDVGSRTRILAVCGCVDLPIQGYDEAAAHPNIDGWFFSDFFAFKHILEGAGCSQTWLTSETPKYLVTKYGSYLHGNPYKDRKIVLDRILLGQGFGKGFTIGTRQGLKDEFLGLLHREASLARQNQEKLLILTFCHGDSAGHPIILGTWEDENEIPMAQFRTVVGSDIDVTLITTACFSGGYAVNPHLNWTVFATAGPERESISWGDSRSTGRYCGSIVATALIEAWKDEARTAEVSQDLNQAPVDAVFEEKTLAKFTGDMYDTLFDRVDRLGAYHDIRFSAQDDDWESAWRSRTGAPLISFRQRWDTLRTHSPSNPEDPNWDPLTDLGNRDPRNLLNPPSGPPTDSQFGSLSWHRRRIQLGMRTYFSSYPGPNNLSSNTLVHGIFRLFREQQARYDLKQLNAVWRILKYRLNLMEWADRLLAATQIPKPRNRTCAETNVQDFDIWSSTQLSINNKYHAAMQLVDGSIVPKPCPTYQGNPFVKVQKYLAIALALFPEIENSEDMKEWAQKLKQEAFKMFLGIKKGEERKSDVHAMRRGIWSSFGKRLRSLSPDKHRKRLSVDEAKTSSLGLTPSLKPGGSSKGKGMGKAKDEEGEARKK